MSDSKERDDIIRQLADANKDFKSTNKYLSWTLILQSILLVVKILQFLIL